MKMTVERLHQLTPRVDQADWPAMLQTLHEAGNDLRHHDDDFLQRFTVYGGDCSYEVTKKVIMLYSLRVASPLRGQGRGSRLLDAVKAVARREHKPILLSFEPDPGQEDALRRFYRRHGFRFLSDNVSMRWQP